ncbi:hypothetical protein FRC12_001379 [Ceratobasidium sp. 428]|nr:hypothetical protein FRC12_001379 [Ceratobasidium sp. 428]
MALVDSEVAETLEKAVLMDQLIETDSGEHFRSREHQIPSSLPDFSGQVLRGVFSCQARTLSLWTAIASVLLSFAARAFDWSKNDSDRLTTGCGVGKHR